MKDIQSEPLQTEFDATASPPACAGAGSDPKRVTVTLDMDADLLAWLKAQPTDWQREINNTMRFSWKPAQGRQSRERVTIRRPVTAPSDIPLPGKFPKPLGACQQPHDVLCLFLCNDFASPYRKVPYLGIWADETADQYGKRDAMAVLADAAGCCFDDDVRQRPELGRALAYLARETSRAVYVNRFRKALEEPNPVIRFRAAGDAYRALARRIG
jgi:uncharacterized protein (DUF4415 family)